jgi:Flp pilus assembly protein TadG
VTKHSRIRRIWRDCTAAEVAEAAFVLPLMFVFLLGIFQFARVYMVYSTMQRAAQEGAHAAAGSNCATCGNAQIPADVVASTYVHPVFQISHVDDSQLIATAPATPLNSCSTGTPVTCSGTSATPNICLRRDVVLNIAPGGGGPTSGTKVCGTALSLTYPYGFSLPSVSTTAPYISTQAFVFDLHAQAQVVAEN